MNNPTWEALVIPLQQGSTGKPVTALQGLLQRNGYSVTVNSIFDASTTSAVQALQSLHGLPTNGAVDLNTWCVAVGGNLSSEFI